ncbi:hypothetical protein FA13DRAFT_1738947 [Coprinellus micaceus]|uniref:DUF6533 domain-containing protein n=1 Tax=Coprinellus micaceus TaxID=71717 RepID=A0A4Y7SST4_COPMI|nr:hypothetical protein FA13DRAFT_1738947 [Coprinellus micaceus]
MDGSNPLALLFKAFEIQIHTGWSQAAALTFLLCDYLHNFSDEVRYIWPTRWSLAKILYLTSRYYGILIVTIALISDRHRHSIAFCKTYLWVMIFGFMSTMEIILNIILILRLYALYGRSKRALAFFSTLYMIQLAVEIYTITWVLQLSVQSVIHPPLPKWTGCVTLAVGIKVGKTIAGWIPALVVSTIFLIATFWKLRQTFMGSRINHSHANTGERFHIVSPLLKVFVRDGAFYFVLIAITQLLKGFVTIYEGSLYTLPTNAWIWSMYSMAGSHMLLNLRRSGDRGTPTQGIALDNLSSSETGAMSTIRFKSVAED